MQKKNNAQASLDMGEQPTPILPDTFEEAYADLQEIVSKMESGQMTLEDSLSAYQHGDALLQFCQKKLSDVEQQVQILNKQQLEPYQADDDIA